MPRRILPRPILLLLLAAVAAALLALLAQQPGGVDELRARSAQDLAYQAAYASAPGGTPEERHWEVLVLMGTGDTTPADFSGNAAITAGDLFEIHGYRIELPDRVLPQGGWQIHTKVENILENSPIEGSGKPTP